MITLQQYDALGRVRSAAESYGIAVLGESPTRIGPSYNELSDAINAAVGLGLKESDAMEFALAAARVNNDQVASRLRQIGRRLHTDGTYARADQILSEQLTPIR